MDLTNEFIVYSVDESAVPWNLGTCMLPDWSWVVGGNSEGNLSGPQPGAIWCEGNKPTAPSRGNVPANNMEGTMLYRISPAVSSLPALQGTLLPGVGLGGTRQVIGLGVPVGDMEPVRKTDGSERVSTTGDDMEMARLISLYTFPDDSRLHGFNAPLLFNGLMAFTGGMNSKVTPRIILRWDDPEMEEAWKEWRGLRLPHSVDLGPCRSVQRIKLAKGVHGAAENRTSTPIPYIYTANESIIVYASGPQPEAVTGNAMTVGKVTSAEWVTAAHTAVGKSSDVTGVRTLPGLLIVEGTAQFAGPSMFLPFKVSGMVEEEQETGIAHYSASNPDYSCAVADSLSVDISGNNDLSMFSLGINAVTVTGGVRAVTVSSELLEDVDHGDL